MNQQDLILDFIDGKIDPEQNDILFEHLHYDDAARQQFSQQIQLLLNVNRSLKTMPVPSVVTDNIFAELGIKTNLLVSLLNRVRQSRIAKTGLVLVGLMFVAFTSFYTGKWFNENINAHNANNSNFSKTIPIVTSVETTTKSGTSIDEYAPGMNKYAQQSTTFQNHSYLVQLATFTMLSNSIENYFRGQYINLISKNTKNNLNKTLTASLNNTNLIEDNIRKNQAETEFFNSEINQSLSSSKTNKVNLIIDLSSNKYRYLSNNQLVTFISSILPHDYKYEISLSNLHTQSSYPDGLSASKSMQFDFNARYNLNTNSSIGINLGKDKFPQEFSREIQGKQFTQIQSPDLYYLGLTYRYNYFQSPTNPGLLPFFDLTLGATQIGPLLKGQIGVNIPVWNRIELNLGLLNSLLIYNVDNRIYSTNKLNFVYGLNIKL